jgi:hypothetical protein
VIGSLLASRRHRHRSPRLCGLWAMEARCILTLVGGRAPSPVLRASFSGFRVKLCRDGAQVVVVTPCAIRSPRLQPNLGGNVERLMGVVWSSWISSRCSDHQGELLW